MREKGTVHQMNHSHNPLVVKLKPRWVTYDTGLPTKDKTFLTTENAGMVFSERIKLFEKILKF